MPTITMSAISTNQSQTRGRTKTSQQHLVTGRGVLSTKLLCCFPLFFLASILCCMEPQSVVHAATNGSPRPRSTVRPPLSPKASRRLSFLPSRSNSRKAAKEAYFLHLQNELESAQRQLYVSQNTCTTLRKRWEDQRRETLKLMTSHVNSNDVEADNEKGLEEEQLLNDQKGEIERLRGQLEMETDKQEQQVVNLTLLAAELKELQVWKEAEEKSNEGKLLGYEQQLQDSQERQSDYADQVALLALKLEAAEFAAKQHNKWEGELGEGSASTWERRTQTLRLELGDVRSQYSKMLLSSLAAQSQEGSTDQQQQIQEEMDGAIQSAVESALETIDQDWAMRYEMIEDQLRNTTEYASSLKRERDAALGQVQGTATSSSVQSGQEEESSDSLKKQTQQLREELTAELTESLTTKLTEKLTDQLTDTLTENMEMKYKKKFKRLRKELKDQQEMASEDKATQKDEAQQQQQQKIEEEIKMVKEQYDLEYESKLQQLQKQSGEQVEVQKARMRKLVQALMEREAKQNGTKAKKKQEGAKQAKSKSSSTKKKKRRENGGSYNEVMGEKCTDEEFIPVSVATSRRSRPGVVPVRGNR